MSGLYGSLSVALSALLAEQGAMEATANNIANINTPGFSRQRPVLSPREPIVVGSLNLGSGVELERMHSLRDPILELRLHEETQQQGYLDSFVSSMRQIEVLFGASGADLGDAMMVFFTSLNQLSTDPASTSLRQGVLTAAGNLADSFRYAASQLTLQKANVDLGVSRAVDEVNVLTRQIADLNGQISAMQNLGEDASAFIDQQTQLIRNLSGLIDVSVIQTESGLSLTTSNGAALVTGLQSFPLSAEMGSDGVQHIISLGSDITAKLTAGRLAGLLSVRDEKIPQLAAQLDQLAAALSSSLNAAHRSGFDANGQPGGDLFVPPSASGVGAAAIMAVAISAPALLAASSDGSIGSNGNLARLAAVHDQAIVAGQTPVDFFAHLTFQLGSDIANGDSELEATELVLRELGNQREAISGVSLDEEAANLVRYQHAYEAAARVISAVNDMLDIAVNLGKV